MFHGVFDIEFGQRGQQIDQILVGHEYACSFFATEVVNVVFFENLLLAGLGGFELACEVVPLTVQGLAEVRSVEDLEVELVQFDGFWVDADEVHSYFMGFVSIDKPTPVSDVMFLFHLRISGVLVEYAHNAL